MAKTKPKTLVIPFRLSPDLVKRLDNHAACWRNKTPGLQVTRADVLRVLLTKALDSEEADGKAKATKD